MARFTFTCPCGEPMDVDANNREEAVKKMKSNMTGEVINDHFPEFHPNEEIPPVTQMYAMIEQRLQPAHAHAGA